MSKEKPKHVDGEETIFLEKFEKILCLITRTLKYKLKEKEPVFNDKVKEKILVETARLVVGKKDDFNQFPGMPERWVKYGNAEIEKLRNNADEVTKLSETIKEIYEDP